MAAEASLVDVHSSWMQIVPDFHTSLATACEKVQLDSPLPTGNREVSVSFPSVRSDAGSSKRKSRSIDLEKRSYRPWSCERARLIEQNARMFYKIIQQNPKTHK
jgi:hypothetical protein